MKGYEWSCLGRVDQASLMRARRLSMPLPLVSLEAKGRRSLIKRSLTISSGVSLESCWAMETTTFASSVALSHAPIWAM